MPTEPSHNPCCHLAELSAFIDGELPAAACAELERHLIECRNCRIVVDTLRSTVSLYQTLDSEESLPAAAEERLWRRFGLADLLPTPQASRETPPPAPAD